MDFQRREDFAEALTGEGVDELVHQAAGPLDGGEVGVHHGLLFGVIALHALTPITREQPRAGHEAWTPRVRLKQVLRSRAFRALSPHPLSPSPQSSPPVPLSTMWRGGTRDCPFVPPLRICGEADRGSGLTKASERVRTCGCLP